MVSIITPVLNEESSIPAFIENICGNSNDFELIIVDGGSKDGTLKACDCYPQAKVVCSEKGRANQMNLGAGLAQGDILLFLHVDTQLPQGGLRAIMEAMEDENVVGGSFFMKFDVDSLPFWFFSLFTKINTIYLTYGDQGIFIRKSVFEEIGGYKKLPIMEDFEIQKRLRKKGRFLKLPIAVTTSARRFLRNGVFKQQFINIALLLAYEMGYPPLKIKKFYADINH